MFHFSVRDGDHSDDEVDEEVERGVDRDEGVRDPVQDLHPPGPLHVAEAAARRRHDLNMSDDDHDDMRGGKSWECGT